MSKDLLDFDDIFSQLVSQSPRPQPANASHQTRPAGQGREGPAPEFSVFDDLASLDTAGTDNFINGKTPAGNLPAQSGVPAFVGDAKDDDDWGDFEDAESSTAPPVIGTLPTRIDPAAPPHLSQALGSGTRLAEDPFSDAGRAFSFNANPISQSTTAKQPPPTGKISSESDVWDDFNGLNISKRSGAGQHTVVSKTNTGNLLDDDIFSSPPAVSLTSQLGQFSQPPARNAPLPIHVSEEPKPPKPRDPNVLFDAEDENIDEDDDFGDFEAGEAPVNHGPVSAPKGEPINLLATLDLLDSQFDMQEEYGDTGSTFTFVKKQSAPRTQSLKSNTSASIFKPKATSVTQDRTSRQSATHRQATSATPAKSTAQSQAIQAIQAREDDLWADWDEMPASQKADSNNGAPTATALPQLPISEPPSNDSASTGSLLPPPSLLLPLFPPIFSLAQSSLFTPITTLSQSQKHTLIISPQTLSFLTAYLELSRVLARILAGRKQRWKRDTQLAQSMRIAPAAAGGSKGSGLKLTGLDKGEMRREDQAAEDALREWRAQLGRLRSVVTLAKNANPTASQLGSIPDIQPNMVVKTISQAEGGVSSLRPCALCGLKRDERVRGVDEDVQDVFGEWWVETWVGHRMCRNFWEGNKDSLRAK